MTVKLKNVSGEVRYLGSANGRRVEVGEVIEVDGTLAPKKDQPDDAVLVGEGDDARLYPHSTWKVAAEPSKGND